MTGTWKLLRSLLREAEYHGYGKGLAPKPPKAKSPQEYRDDIFKYITQRYGEHDADEVQAKMRSLSFKEFKREVALKYFDPKLDGLIDSMAKQAIALHKAKQAPPPEETPGHKVGPSGRVFTEPGGADERQARIDAMRQARQAPSGGQSAAQALMTPGKGGNHAVGSAGQNQPKQQPSIAAGIEPQRADPSVVKRQSRSGLVRAQREVDKETREKGVAAGEKLAKSLGVPTTADRTRIDPDTSDKSIQIWGPDRIFKHMDIDQTPGGSGGRSDAERKAQSHKRSQDAQAGQIDPDRLEKIKRGLLKRNAAPEKLGPDRPGSFHGERWKPHGREEEVPMSRPDAATGNWSRGKRVMNPKHTGAELVWNKYASKWQLPSVYASQEAERGAALKSKGVGLRSRPDQDFGDEKTDPQGELDRHWDDGMSSSDFSDDKTDPDASAFPEED